ncbi:hypothetical protein [Austwickia chelonae]|uniref:hypothetical protein n=1 Tax=Austwickia chelonae TaxID=100225 RepID=UPI001C3F280F|nr:hypothetical protein [Austwickia chelonae]
MGIATVAAVAMSAGLAGCGNMDPSAAAIVDGHVIKEADLAAFIEDVKRMPGTSSPVAAEVLTQLIISKVIVTNAEELKITPISADTVRQQLKEFDQGGQKIEGWHDSTIEVLRGIQMANSLKQNPVRQAAMQRMQKSEVTVNPKYGQFDRQRIAMVPSTPNWMKTPDAGQLPPGHPTMPPGHPGGGQPGGGQQPPEQEAPKEPPATLPGAPAPKGDAPKEDAPKGGAPAPADNKPAEGQ